MVQAGKIFYDSIKKYSDLERLVNEGESESLFLECKSPLTPSLNVEFKEDISQSFIRVL